MPTISNRLKKHRKARGLSMRDAAKAIGIPETTYRDWEYGRKIRGEPYAKIAKAFGISIEVLLLNVQDHLTIEQRLNRIKEDVGVIEIELRKTKQQRG